MVLLSHKPTTQDLTVNSALYLLHISLRMSYEDVQLDQDNNFKLVSLSILKTYLLDDI